MIDLPPEISSPAPEHASIGGFYSQLMSTSLYYHIDPNIGKEFNPYYFACITMKNIETFKNLQENWDGYSALAIHPNSMHSAIAFLKQYSLQTNGLQAFPVPNGGVQIEISLANKFIEIEFDPNKTIVTSETRATGECIEMQFDSSTNHSNEIFALIG